MDRIGFAPHPYLGDGAVCDVRLVPPLRSYTFRCAVSALDATAILQAFADPRVPDAIKRTMSSRAHAHVGEEAAKNEAPQD